MEQFNCVSFKWGTNY